VFPNPARDRVSIWADRPRELPAWIALHDATGRRIATHQLPAGRVRGSFPVAQSSGSGLPTGCYYVRVLSGGMSATVPVQVVR
jgi:hypothetical protein